MCTVMINGHVDIHNIHMTWMLIISASSCHDNYASGLIHSFFINHRNAVHVIITYVAKGHLLHYKNEYVIVTCIFHLIYYSSSAKFELKEISIISIFVFHCILSCQPFVYDDLQSGRLNAFIVSWQYDGCDFLNQLMTTVVILTIFSWSDNSSEAIHWHPIMATDDIRFCYF